MQYKTPLLALPYNSVYGTKVSPVSAVPAILGSKPIRVDSELSLYKPKSISVMVVALARAQAVKRFMSYHLLCPGFVLYP